MRGEEVPVIVELKRSFSIPLLVQGIDRLALTDKVYVAFELPFKGKAPHKLSWREVERLCRMLGLGLLTVQFYKRNKPSVEVVCHPVPYVPRANKRGRERMLSEFKERSGDYNIGGTTRTKLVTAYREKALHCAHLLQVHGPLSPRELKIRTGNMNVAGMLQKNYYRWFRRKQRGIYEITPLGIEALATYGHVVEKLCEKPQI